jgi:CheY-like chemotaxis protein
VVLAVVDDLMFSSRIRAAVEQAGDSVTFIRGRMAVLPEVRSLKPRLVVLDLDRTKTDPVALVRELKSQPDLRTVRLVGFVSHVHAATIQAARDAGIDLVLARSAFFAVLPRLVAEAALPGSAG